MSKQRLVVIGNGMAGRARRRGDPGARRRRPVRHRHVRRRALRQLQPHPAVERPQRRRRTRARSSSTACRWYEENGITPARRRARRPRSTASAKRGLRRTADRGRALRQAAHRHRQPRLHPADQGRQRRRRQAAPGRVRLPHARRLPRHRRDGAQAQAARSVIGGGLLGLEAARGLLTHGCEVHVVHLAQHLMNQQLDTPAAASCATRWRRWACTVHLGRRSTTRGARASERVTGLAFKDGTTLDCDMVVISAGIKPNAELGAARAGSPSSAAIVVDNHMRSVDDFDVYVVGECAQHRGVIYGLVAPLWEQAKVLADHITGRNPDAAYHGSKLATKLKVMGVELASMGITEPAERAATRSSSSPSRSGPLQEADHPQRPAGRRDPAGRSRQGRLPDAGLRPEQRRCPTSGCRCCSTSARRPRRSPSTRCRPRRRSATATASPRGRSAPASRRGKRTPKLVMEATRAGMGCGSCKALVAELVAWFCGGEAEEDPIVALLRAGDPAHASRSSIEAIRERGLQLGVGGVRARWPAARRTPRSKPALASLLAVVWKGEYDDERDARFINDRVHGNIQKDGTFSVIPEMPGGICTPDELRRIADVADKYQRAAGQADRRPAHRSRRRHARTTCPRVWRDLGMPAGYAWGKSYRTCKSCIGVDYCRFGLGDSMGLAVQDRAALPRPRQPRQAEARDRRLPAQLLGGAGQGRGRGRGRGRQVGDLRRRRRRLARPQGRPAVHRRQRGRGAAPARAASSSTTARTPSTRSAPTPSSSGSASSACAPSSSTTARASRRRSTRAMQASVDATYDPWLERDAPKTANQFASIITTGDA